MVDGYGERRARVKEAPTVKIPRMATIRRWWPVPAVLMLGLVAEQIFRAQYPTATEHAAGHLGSATAVFIGVAVLALIFWATPGALRRPELVVAGALWIGALVANLVANVRVVEAIGAQGWTDEQADRLGASIPDLVSGHELAGTAGWVGVGAMVVFAILMYLRRYVSPRAAIGSIVLSIVVPPWILFGAGVLVLLVAVCLARGKLLGAERSALSVGTAG
jgi:hypothetical protein